MKVPKYVQEIMERAEFLLGEGIPGYTIKLHKATHYTRDNAINNEAERLVAWARRNGSTAYVNSYVRGTHYCDQYALVTILDPVMKYIEGYMNYKRQTRYGSCTGKLPEDTLDRIYGDIYCPLSKMDEALDNIKFE